MSQQIIDIGAEANDGTGEPLRSAFSAVNENFSEVYAAGPVGSNVTISGNTITVSGINNNLVLAANGIGNVQSNSTIMPSVDGVYDIGSANMRFGDIHGTYIYGNGAFLTGVAGGSGNSISNGDSSVTIPTINGNVVVAINGANALIVQRQNVVVNANVVPGANVTYSLGSAAAAWQDLYLSNSTIYLGNSTVRSNATSFTLTTPTGGSLVLQGNGTVTNYANANVAAFLPTYTGNVRAGNEDFFSSYFVIIKIKEILIYINLLFNLTFRFNPYPNRCCNIIYSIIYISPIPVFWIIIPISWVVRNKIYLLK